MARARGTRGKRLKRKSFFVDEALLRRAKRALGVGTEAEVVRQSVERMTEMALFWRMMDETRGLVEPGSVEVP